ncbi:MAG: D-alanyl-D-alanine carboxypeptidase/D-alanyl-D-alanine-endopeptidase [Patulibacter sp.]
MPPPCAAAGPRHAAGRGRHADAGDAHHRRPRHHARAGQLVAGQSARALPGNSSALVRDQASQEILAQRGATTKRIPASVTKLFTTSSALLLDGADARLTTELRIDGEIDEDGVLQGDLIVRGAGDPALRLDQITQLATAAKKAGIERLGGTLRADLGGWTTQQGTPVTGGIYHSDIGGRIGALVTLRGFASGGGTDPARQVLSRLTAALRAGGLKGSVKIAAPAPSVAGTTVIGKVNSPTIGALIAATNLPSDNFYAEMLLRGLGARHGSAGTTAAGVAVEKAALAKLGVVPSLVDGSGLARADRVAPSTIVKLLDQMAGRDEGSALRASMPVAGLSGTLAGRMRGSVAQGRCRAKTGTLSNVSALAGYCTTRGGRTVTFAILNNNVNVASARKRQDRILATIANWTDAAPAAKRSARPAVASRVIARPEPGFSIPAPGSLPGTGD